MLAWKENESIDFDFTSCQLQDEVRSSDEAYIKSRVRERLNMAGTYALLIGGDTRYKHKYVLWEAEVALEKESRIIGINLDGSRSVTDECPSVIRDIGAMFVPFSPAIVAYALENYEMHEDRNWHYKDEIYRQLRYDV